MTSRHALETKTVATLRKVLPLGRRGAIGIHTTRARFNRQMAAWGYSCDATYLAWRDCVDMAELENNAE